MKYAAEAFASLMRLVLLLKYGGCELKNTEQLRRKGMTLTELLVALSVSTVVLLIVVLITTQSLRITKATEASMSLDEQISKLHSSLNYIISRQFTALGSFTYSEDVPEGKVQEITLYSGVPGYSVDVISAVSTITYDSSLRKVIHQYYNKSGSLVSSVIAENVVEFEFDPVPLTSYLTYRATFTYFDPVSNGPILTRSAGGAVRFY